MSAMLEKTYQPSEHETGLYKKWEDAGAFRLKSDATKPERSSATEPSEAGGKFLAAGALAQSRAYTISLPPPNVTGSLHMGHALNATLQDVLIRYYRMRGRAVLWQPGVDHAGIATQLVVERQLAARQLERRTMGRDAFQSEVWKWKDESGGLIEAQLRRLGASCDWSRSRFTLDEDFAKAVNKVFVKLYKEGLIYRDKRLVHWHPALETAVSDLEVAQREEQGQMWHFRYPPADDKNGKGLIVATTRPETLFGDTAVCVHPEDERYRALIGSQVIVPLAERAVPVIADEAADPEQGSGALKVTPAHDFADFEIGQRHELEMINIFDKRAHLNDKVPERFRGLERYEARKLVVAEMEKLGLLVETESHKMALPYGERTEVVLEPRLTEQWYVNAAKLAGPAMAAVKKGETKFVPPTWEKTYFRWLEDIQPWCISRQLWWGHRIPIWYGEDGEPFAAESEAEAVALAAAHYGKEGAVLRQDEDVLDTWFSSALWPFVTLGWPEETKELAAHYPNDCLVTGFDIIFFWVARMMMMGLRFTGEVPFKEVYIHALVRDAAGQKMSKSRGNIVNPLEVIEKFSADALRFTLASMASPGRDIRLQEQRLAGARNFASKLWNAARFAQMHDAFAGEFNPEAATHPLAQWLVNECAECVAETDAQLAVYRFDLAADAVYHFIWHRACDWFLELCKPILQGGDEAAKQELRGALGWLITQMLHLLHPFMPFVTEHLWQELKCGDGLLMEQAWPRACGKADYAQAQVNRLIGLVERIRSLRSELKIPPAARLDFGYTPAQGGSLDWASLAHLARVKAAAATPPDANAIRWKDEQGAYALLLDAPLDVPAETKRVRAEVATCDVAISQLEKQMELPDFVAKAPPEVVAQKRERLDKQKRRRVELGNVLTALNGMNDMDGAR